MTTLVSTSANFDLSQIFTSAWNAVKSEGIALSEALRKAWATAKKALSKLNFQVEKFAELTIDELASIKASIEALIEQKTQLPNKPEVELCDDIKLEVKDGKVFTTSYYNSCFVSKARGLQGKWEAGKWVFPVAILDHVKNAMIECYSVTGETPYPVCVLGITGYSDSEYSGGCELFGRPIAKAYGRDSGAKLQDHIIKISGRITSGGSVKNWKTVIDDATIEIHKFPVAALDRKDVKDAIENGWCVIK